MDRNRFKVPWKRAFRVLQTSNNQTLAITHQRGRSAKTRIARRESVPFWLVLSGRTTTSSRSHFENHFCPQNKILQTKAVAGTKLLKCDIWFLNTQLVLEAEASFHRGLPQNTMAWRVKWWQIWVSPLALPDLWKWVWGGLVYLHGSQYDITIHNDNIFQ